MASSHLFYNARVYTADADQPWAEAFVVEDDRFAFVGSIDEARDRVGGSCEQHDMQGRLVLPGLFDTHSHYLMLSSWSSETSIAVDFNLSHEDVLEFVADIARKHSVSELPIISGLGFGPSCIQLASELDKAVSDRPVLLLDSGGHSGWMNTKMIEHIGVTAETPDPQPGASYFVRDEQGNPTGQVVEADAVAYTIMQSGIASLDILKTELPDQMTNLNSFGYTSVFDAGIFFFSERDTLEALQDINLTTRFFTSFYYNGKQEPGAFLSEMIALKSAYTTSLTRPVALKMFKDGTIEAFNAYMIDDYLPPGSGRGAETLTTKAMEPMAHLAAKNDFDVHIHAIGDRAIAEVLDLYADIGPTTGTKTIAHVQVLPENGIERFATQTDVVYQTTPVWLQTDQFTCDVLGKTRSLRQMPLNSIVKGGSILSFGSDAPVSGGMHGVNPFNNIAAAVCRSDESAGFISPTSEALDVATCVDAYTINGARQVRAENEIGSITAGKQADFAVLDRDIFTIDSHDIDKTKVLETWLNGTLVYKGR